MKKKSKLPPAKEINLAELSFHAYFVRCRLRLDWRLGDGGAMSTPAMYEALKRYLEFVYGQDEWMKARLLNLLREQTYKEIKQSAIHYYPVIKNNKNYIPPEISIDTEFLKEPPAEIEKEKEKEEKPQLNFPGLTLENFAEKMGKRFRMTREQKQRGLTREQAFKEYGISNN